MLWQRLTFGSLMIAALAGLFWVDAALQNAPTREIAFFSARHRFALSPANGLPITGVWAALVVLATSELGLLLRQAGHRPAVILATFCNIALATIPWTRWNLLQGAGLEADMLMAVLVIAAIGAFVVVAARRQIEHGATDIAVTVFMVVYLGLLGSFIPRFRIWASTPWLLLYVLLVIKSCDIGAYFTGVAIGRVKLIPWLSPKKTVEGLLGGIAFSMAAAAYLSALAAEFRVGGAEAVWPDMQKALILGGVLAVAGQAGDLFESLLKRSAGAKDSGAVVPAFGGILDIIDSPLVCVPTAYYLLLQ